MSVAPFLSIEGPLRGTFGSARVNLENDNVKTFPISVNGVDDVCLSMGDVISPFELSSLSEGNSRKSLTLRLPKTWEEAIECMEACLLHRVQTERLFQYAPPSDEALGSDEVEAIYKPCSQNKNQFSAAPPRQGEHRRISRLSLLELR